MDSTVETQNGVSLLSDKELNWRVFDLEGKWERVFSERQSALTRKKSDALCFRQLPDYCNDLNAMHEAETIFVTHGSPHQIAYKFALWDVTDYGHNGDWSIIRATSRQRAEAFVKVLSEENKQPETNENEPQTQL